MHAHAPGTRLAREEECEHAGDGEETPAGEKRQKGERDERFEHVREAAERYELAETGRIPQQCKHELSRAVGERVGVEVRRRPRTDARYQDTVIDAERDDINGG